LSNNNNKNKFQLIVHSPADVPVGIQPTAYVTGSSMLSVALSLNIIRTSHKIKKWTPKLRNCYYQHEKKLKFFKIYTLHNCEMECRANNTLNVCGCNAYFQPSEYLYAICIHIIIFILCSTIKYIYIL